MGVLDGCLGGWHLICNECGIVTEFEICPAAYNASPEYWDNWCCTTCQPDPKQRVADLAKYGINLGEMT
jgi:hypothetical protein